MPSRFLSNVNINQVSYNLLLVRDRAYGSVYGIDADSGISLWHVSTLQGGETTSGDHGCGQISPEKSASPRLQWWIEAPARMERFI